MDIPEEAPVIISCHITGHRPIATDLTIGAQGEILIHTLVGTVTKVGIRAR